MNTRTRIVRLGKMHGVRFSVEALEESGLTSDVEGHRIVIDPTQNPREGWEESFIEMTAHGDDQMLDPETPTEWK